MPIKNRGSFSLDQVFERQVNQDWPAANTDFDLYVQDLVAGGNVIANGLIIRNIEVSDNILTGNITAATITANTLTLDVITANIFNGIDTDQVAEGTANLYYTDSRVVTAVTPLLTTANVIEEGNLYFTLARAREAYSAGLGIAISTGGVISAKGDDTGTGMFNSGINLSVGQLVSNVYANLATFSAVDGDSFIVYSLHATNITGNTVYLNGRYVIDNKNAANTVLFANLFEIPGNTSLELLRKPQVFKPDDQIQLLSYRDPRQPANDLVSVYMSYQASQDTAYKRVANTITNNKLTEVFRTPGQTSIIESLVLNNLSPNVIPVTTFIVDSSNNVLTYLTSNLSVPPRTSVEICEYPKAVSEDHKIRINKFGAVNDQLTVFITSKFTTYYAITPSSANISEGGSITFNIETLNIGNGTTLYYTLEEVSGNITQDDFITDISGEVTIQNDAAVLTLQSNADASSFIEGPDIFRLQLRKGSTLGTIVSTSSNVTILDTSNTRTALINVSGLGSLEPNITVEGDVLTITINTTNFQNNDTLYYSMTGNALNTHFVEANTGTLIVTDNSNTFTLTTTGIPTNTTRTFDIEIRDTDENGELLINSGLITVLDAGVAYSSATGGTVFTEADPVTGENYKVHVFATSGNFVVSQVGQLYSNIEYVVVGGGGSGGTAESPGQGRSGGGGAGGFITGNILLTPGTKVMSIGAGGVVPSNRNNFNGGNTGFFGNVIVAYGGGKGARASTGLAGGATPGNLGGIGGSGGGYSTDGSNPPPSIPAGTAYDPAQGNPGALAGGGAGGPGAAPLYGIGRAVTWLSNASYGTGGPAPGRWFAGGGAGGNAPSAIVPAGGGGVHLNVSPWSTTGNVNTGGGGAGGSSPVGPALAGGQQGGSGIIIVRYRTQ